MVDVPLSSKSFTVEPIVEALKEFIARITKIHDIKFFKMFVKVIILVV
jgi:hypothetical protein